ncbi:RNA-guided endonuclease InsQ/TnpB family protein [Clostridium aciditolerans]|uniref:Transposase n=1 Tax=Clostridium aciditolerans TaxID=339861 RepID=A0A934HZF2_9CLOT|nr:RNA-guided endonuclease TnpB family protein [Clostridium aciditolerans]MBI6873563.1 transposase [Clostridium aciditolerans]
MIKAVKIRLKPTKEQEMLMFKSVGCARFAYNWGLAKWEEMNKQDLKPSKVKIRTEFNNTIKKNNNYVWLKEVSAQVTQHAFEDLNDAYNKFFKGLSMHPKFKSKKKSKNSFYVRYDAIKFKDGTVNIEKIGKVKYKTNYEIPILSKYNNPRCEFDGKYWYLTFGFEHNENQVELNKNLSIGIDLGIKNFAVINCLDKPIKTINKSVKVRKLKKKLKRLQRQVSRKYEANKKDKKFVKTKNIIKLEKQIKLIYRKLNNIRLNYIHQATNKIVKLKPYRIIMEDLNISGMMKNKHLAESIQEQKFYEFIRQIKYKCEFNGIEFVQADRFYSSSKICSCCGNKKDDLKLKDRIYVCNKCGLEIDRDKNASINLGNYKLA